MKHLELHILQSFPVSCLNRDDLNSPKTAIFGGVQRARVSSQSWKSAIRELSKEELPEMAGQRTKRIVHELVIRLNEKLDEKTSVELAQMIASQLSTLDSKKDEAGHVRVKTICFLSPMELDSIAESVLANENLLEKAKELSQLPQEEEKKSKKLKNECQKLISQKEIAKAIKSVKLKDAADIALFGRMVADEHSLMVEGASMFGHAISTHKVDNEIDFFTAIDDLQPKEDAGAGMTGTLEFNSATYYRFAAINFEMFADKSHLAELTTDERKKIISAFVRSTLMAVPVARKNSMNANTFPGFVMGIVREKGHPIQLVNAFEKPIRGNGVFDPSVDALIKEYAQIKETWDLDEQEKLIIPEINLPEFLKKVCAYVI